MILAIDQGTTGTTCLVYDAEGNIRGRGYQEFTQYFPGPGFVEHDAEEIWSVTHSVAHAAAAAAKVKLDDLSGIGITNQRETIVLWDRATGMPVHRALVWQDGRTAALCRQLKEQGEEPEVRRRTGLMLDPYFSATKLAWLLDHAPELRPRAEAGELAAGTIDSWLVWKLTDGDRHVTDHTNASRTLLYNLETAGWDPDLLELFGVPSAVLPDIRTSSEEYATTSGSAFGATIPIAGIAGDQQAALYGHGCWSPGLAKNTYGTGAFLLLHTGNEQVQSEGLLTTVACGPRGERRFALEAPIFVAGAAVQWLRDGLGIIENAADSEEIAVSLSGNDGVYFVPAFTGLGAPHWDPLARGTIVGLTRGTGREHLVRAALEAMAYSTVDAARVMERQSGVAFQELRVDGGATENDWLMQFQADVLGVAVRRPELIEVTAIGAAGLAGVAVGLWSSPDDFLATRQNDDLFNPEADDAQRNAWLRGWHRALRAAQSWSGDEP